MTTTAPTAYWTSGEMPGRTANQDGNILSVFQGIEFVTVLQLTGEESNAEVWGMIHNARTVMPIAIGARTGRHTDYSNGTRFRRHTRVINGNSYDFSRITGRDGQVSLRVYRSGTTELLHSFN